MSVATARAVSRRFGGFTAVDSVDLSIRRGEVVGLLGANGAGKTTLIRMLLGLLAPSAGTITLFGGPPDRAARARTGYVPQGLGLYDDLTVRANLQFVAAAYGAAWKTPADPGVAAEVDTVVSDLPLGLRRRTAFAAALAHRPELLLLDEPTSGVDAVARAQLWDTIRGAAESGAAVLVSTHYLEEAQNCDRLAVMRSGRVVADGPLSEIVGGHSVLAVRTPDWPSAFRALEDARLPVSLAGTDLRVASSDPRPARRALAQAGIDAQVSTVPASFAETFVLLSTEAATTAPPPARRPDEGMTR